MIRESPRKLQFSRFVFNFICTVRVVNNNNYSKINAFVNSFLGNKIKDRSEKDDNEPFFFYRCNKFSLPFLFSPFFAERKEDRSCQCPSFQKIYFNKTIHSREGRDIRDIGSRGNIFPRCYRKNGDETIGASGPRKRSRGCLVKHRWIPLHLAGFRLDVSISFDIPFDRSFLLILSRNGFEISFFLLYAKYF